MYTLQKYNNWNAQATYWEWQELGSAQGRSGKRDFDAGLTILSKVILPPSQNIVPISILGVKI